ncbi:MAG: WD40/YVTN/BNR-like repeat-containing protein [Pyrinomonadaceae bacterium]
MTKPLLFFSLLVVTLSLCCVPAHAGWQKVDLNSFAWLHTIEFSSVNTGWLGGSRGTLFKSIDGGNTWKKIDGVTKDNIVQIRFINEKEGWIICQRNMYTLGENRASYMLHTRNAGAEWELVELPTRRSERITRFFFSKNGFGLAIGEMGVLLGLSDGGNDWQEIRLPSSYLMFDGAFADAVNTAVVGGGGTILFSQDAGVSWNSASVAGSPRSKFNGVEFVDSRIGYAVGADGAVFQTRNSGKSWFAQKAPVKEQFNSVAFSNTSTGWIVGDGGKIIATNSAGSQWFLEPSGTSHRLEEVYINGKDVWAIGNGGTILRNSNGAN